jgi:hypothetical protein
MKRLIVKIRKWYKKFIRSQLKKERKMNDDTA